MLKELKKTTPIEGNSSMDNYSAFNVLKSNNLIVSDNLPEIVSTWTRRYNCWGFVAFLFGWINKEAWLQPWEIDDLLHKNTDHVPLKNARAGDIVCIVSKYGNEHTGILSPKNDRGQWMIFHKPGGRQLTYETLGEGILTYAGYKHKLLIQRPKGIAYA